MGCWWNFNLPTERAARPFNAEPAGAHRPLTTTARRMARADPEGHTMTTTALTVPASAPPTLEQVFNAWVLGCKAHTRLARNWPRLRR